MDEKRRLSQIIEPGQSINKKSYVFDPKRDFSNVRKYKVRYTDEFSLASIRAMINDSLAPKGKKPKHTRPPVNYKAILFRLLKLLIPFLLIGLIGIFVLMAIFPPKAPTNPVKPAYSMNYTYRFVNTEVISFRDPSAGDSLKAYATISLNGTGINSTQIDMRLYGEPIPGEIFLLKSRRYEPEKYDEFRAKLYSELRGSGLQLNEIDINQLMHSPENASMILIVASGLVPTSFLGLDDPNFNLRKLLDNKDVVIYLGYKFDAGAIGENGSVKGNVDVAPALKKLEIRFDDLPENTKLSEGFLMKKADYRIGLPSSQLLYNGISVMSGKSGGKFMVFPNSLRYGWDYGGMAADDVYSLIRNLSWMRPLSWAPTYVVGNSDPGGKVEATPTIFSRPYSERMNTTAQFIIRTTGFDKETNTWIEYVEFPIVAKGTLDNVDWAIPSSVCNKSKEGGCDLYMTIYFNESTSRSENMKLVAYKDGARVWSWDIGPRNTGVTEKLLVNVNLPYGDYVLKVEDDSGHVYAQSYLHVAKMEVSPIERPTDFAKGTFFFNVLADGNRLPDGFEVKDIYIALDDQQNQSLVSQVLYGESGRVLYVFSGTIPEGNHYFSIGIGQEKQRITRNFFKRREFWENPLWQGGIVVAIIIFAIAMLVQRPESAIFQLDVPDFPPLSKTKVPISREQACQIFELVNADYRWRYMPLKHGEIKNGFRKLSYKGRPILVSDYNLERLLDQLTSEGLVKNSMDFYGLASWEMGSGKSLEYLALFRSLRDAFLNMSVHFTDFGERTDCDIRVSAQDRYYVHIYSGSQTIARALETVPKGKTVIAFKDQEAVGAFRRSLSSTNRSAIIAKLYVDNENLFVATPSDIEGVIK